MLNASSKYFHYRKDDGFENKSIFFFQLSNSPNKNENKKNKNKNYKELKVSKTTINVFYKLIWEATLSHQNHYQYEINYKVPPMQFSKSI